MPTAGSILLNAKKMFGDPDSDWLTDSTGLDWLDRAQRRFCHKVMPLDEFQDFALVAKINRYSVAADCITPVALMWYQATTRKLLYAPPEKMAKIEEAQPNSNGTPDYYAFIRRQLILDRIPTTTSATALASGVAFASATAIALTGASGVFRGRGFIKNVTSGEVMEFNTISGATVSGITRGIHNTTAASVASADQFQQMDLVMSYRKSPAVLSATTSTPEIPVHFHDYLEKYALYLAWLARGDQTKADRALLEFEQYEKDSVKTIGRRAQDGMIKIQESRRRGWWF